MLWNVVRCETCCLLMWCDVIVDVVDSEMYLSNKLYNDNAKLFISHNINISNIVS